MATCAVGNDYNGDLGTRISAIFVIGIGSFLGVPASSKSRFQHLLTGVQAPGFRSLLEDTTL